MSRLRVCFLLLLAIGVVTWLYALEYSARTNNQGGLIRQNSLRSHQNSDLENVRSKLAKVSTDILDPAPHKFYPMSTGRHSFSEQYAKTYDASLQAAKYLFPGALYQLDSVLAACQAIPRNETQYQAWVDRHAADQAPDFDYMRKMMEQCAGVPMPSFVQREKLFLTYADKGSSEGYYMLGVLYPHGSEESKMWLQKAAFNGNGDAAKLLAETYLDQGDTEPGRLAAYQWYLVAQDLGKQISRRTMEELASNFSEEEIAKVKDDAMKITAHASIGITGHP